MLGLSGYNFCFDKNALDPMLTNIDPIRSTKIENGIFDQVTLTKNVAEEYSHDKPTTWDFYTILSANLNGTLSAGNVSEFIGSVTKIRVKRRIKDTINWITIAEHLVNPEDPSTLRFNVNDFFNECGIEYEYAFVPMIGDAEAPPSDYIINNIVSKFKGVFICDKKNIYRFVEGVGYGNMTTVQKVGVYEPLGSKYPIIIMNGDTQYRTSSVSGLVMNDDYLDTRKINPKGIIEKRKILEDFLCNKQAKILKDDNGNLWLMLITSTPITTFDNNSHMVLENISFNWTEVGDGTKAQDLYDNGLIEVI